MIKKLCSVVLISDTCILSGIETNLGRCFPIKFRKFRKQVIKVLLLLVAVILEHHYTGARLFIYGGDGSWVDQAIFWPIRTTRVPDLPLRHERRRNWIGFTHKRRGFHAVLSTTPNIWSFVLWYSSGYPIFWLCVGSLPDLVLLAVLAFFSWLGFLRGLWHFLPFQSILVIHKTPLKHKTLAVHVWHMQFYTLKDATALS